MEKMEKMEMNEIEKEADEIIKKLENKDNCEYVVDMNGVLYNTNPCWNCETDLDDYRFEEMDRKRYVVEWEVESKDKI